MMKNEPNFFFKEEIIQIWLRVILYGKLAGISLESAIDDFCYKDGIIIRVNYCYYI